MKILFVILVILTAISFGQFAEGKYELSVSGSSVIWEGNNVAGGGHIGTLQPASGSLLINQGGIKKGDATIDMNTIKSTDLLRKGNGKGLEDHLKNADFFDVAQFPEAMFAIEKINRVLVVKATDQFHVYGFLQIKERTNPVDFIVRITTAGQSIRVTGQIKIDRTKWNVNYQSKTIFSDLKDSIISDEIKINVDLVYVKQQR